MNALIWFIGLCFIAFIALTFAFTLTYFYDFLPVIGQAKPLMQIAYSSTFGFFDRSFLILFVIIIGASALNAYIDPNAGMGLLNIAFLFAFAFVFLTVRGVFLDTMNVMSMQVIFPNMYAVLSSNWSAMFIIGTSALEAIFNFRGKPTPSTSGGENHADSE